MPSGIFFFSIFNLRPVMVEGRLGSFIGIISINPFSKFSEPGNVIINLTDSKADVTWSSKIVHNKRFYFANLEIAWKIRSKVPGLTPGVNFWSIINICFWLNFVPLASLCLGPWHINIFVKYMLRLQNLRFGRFLGCNAGYGLFFGSYTNRQIQQDLFFYLFVRASERSGPASSSSKPSTSSSVPGAG